MAGGVIGNLRVNLGLDSAEFHTGLNKASAGLDKFAAAAKIAGVAIAAAFAAGIGKAVGRVENMEAATRRLDKALQNSGNAAKTSGKEVSEWADKLQRRTGRAAEEVMAVGANLASFNFGEEVFFRAIELADDMSAAWGGDLRSNLEGLSRALDDPANGFAMLRKRGIALTDSQQAMVEKLIAANDKLGAQKLVLEALEAQVKGVAEAGFGGLTKSMANFGVALDGFFDRIVAGTGMGTMLAAGIDQITRAVDFLTANLGTVAEYATFVGGAMTIAFGPMILGAVGSLTVAVGTHLVAAFAALRAIILANPMVAFATAVAVALAAIYHFRDEIKSAIGVDVVGIVQTAANYVINSFRAAFEDIKFVWSNFGNIIGAAVVAGVNVAVKAINSLVTSAKVALNDLIDTINMIPGVEIGRFDVSGDSIGEITNPYAKRLGGALEQHNAKIAEIMASTPIQAIGQMFETSTPAVQNFAAALGGVNDELDEALGGGGSGKGGSKFDKMAQEAARIFEATRTPLEQYQAQIARLNELLAAGAINQDTYNRAVAQAQDAFAKAEQAGKQTENVFLSIGQTITQSIGSAFQGLIDGSKKVKDVLRDLLAQLGQMLVNKAFTSIVGSLFGGGFGGFKIPGFATGTNYAPGGLAWVGERGPELVNLPRGSQVIPNHKLGDRGGGVNVPVNINIDATGADAAGLARVEQQVAKLRRDLPATVISTVRKAQNSNMKLA